MVYCSVFNLIYYFCHNDREKQNSDKLTCDLHQRMKISATILKSSLESESGSFSHRDLERSHNKPRGISDLLTTPFAWVLTSIHLFGQK